ncbi:hypothetical protein [Microvirga antarctica]|uniref:hypothetical protein n=1 Tax=Microvirga antarctica TaxID=2819233 RepID=UPI001B305B46|nr:hypothetical protein [Microvirga antarctica]
MLQRFKTRWSGSTRREKMILVSAPIMAGLLTGLFAASRTPPLDRTAFLKGCLKGQYPGMDASGLQRYCECAADSITPEMLIPARTDPPRLTPELSRLTQACARKANGGG